MEQDLKTAAEVALAKVAPPGLVVVASVGGWGIQEWMYAATFVYVIAQLAYLAWKWRKEWKATRAASAAFKEKIEEK